MIIKGAVKQVYSDYAERFLLVDVRFIEHAHMNDDLAWFALRFQLDSERPASRAIRCVA